MKNVTLEDNNNNIICCLLYGSRVYGTNNEQSDYDFIAVVKDKHDLKINTEVIKIAKEKLGIDMKQNIKVDVHPYTEEEFLTGLNGMEVSFLECVSGGFGKTLFYGKEYEVPKINFTLLRDSFSRKASNSWVKCKKKFIVPEDFNPYIGKKSAWHSLRILDFGKQVADNGKIIDFGSVNHLYDDVMSLESWEEVEQKYKTVYNAFATEFKKSAPKEVVISKPQYKNC